MQKQDTSCFFFGRETNEVKDLINDISASGNSHVEARSSVQDACENADILILAVPYKAEQELARQLKDSVKGKIVISISNPLNESYDGLVTDPDTSAAEELQKALPDGKGCKIIQHGMCC